MGRIKRLGLTALVAALMVAAFAPIAESRGTTRTQGSGWQFDISWTENDPDDLLGLPGNVHIGFLFGAEDQWGRWFWGSITDWDCDPGETPGGHGFEQVVVDETVKLAEQTAADTVEAAVASGATSIAPAAVISAVQSGLAAAVPEAVEDEFPPTCDFVQERSLDGSGLKVAVDGKNGKATITGTLVVTGGHGGGGPVLGRPPANITISGGDWQQYDFSEKSWGANWSYSNARSGINWFGGTVSGSIGAMGFDDDPDDTSWAFFGAFKFRTVDRFR